VATTTAEIADAVKRFQAQVPALAKLRLVFGLELTSRGLAREHEPERFHVIVPGPEASEGEAAGERLLISMPATMFRVLAAEGELADWQEAFHYRHVTVEGDSRVKRLIGQAIEPALEAKRAS
jgi:hypothetical protein